MITLKISEQEAKEAIAKLHKITNPTAIDAIEFNNYEDEVIVASIVDYITAQDNLSVQLVIE